MDAVRLAFADNVFDEVHMHWLLSDPIARDFVQGIGDEAYRVLRPGGCAIVTSEAHMDHSQMLANLGFVINRMDSEARDKALEVLTEIFSDRGMQFYSHEMFPLVDTILGGLLLENIMRGWSSLWPGDSVVVARKP